MTFPQFEILIFVIIRIFYELVFCCLIVETGTNTYSIFASINTYAIIIPNNSDNISINIV